MSAYGEDTCNFAKLTIIVNIIFNNPQLAAYEKVHQQKTKQKTSKFKNIIYMFGNSKDIKLHWKTAIYLTEKYF